VRRLNLITKANIADENKTEEVKPCEDDEIKKDVIKEKQNKPIIEEVKSKKRQPKNKSTAFICKHFDDKFEKIGQLTKHMKLCHTKADTDSGNAITVNSPCLSVKHFFCTCSICGNGYDDYSQLSLHERDVHNFQCEKCEQGFMTKLDLDSHVTMWHTSRPDLETFSDGSQFDEGGVVLQNTEDLKKHLELEHDLNECSSEENSEQPDLKVMIKKLEKELSEKSILLKIVEEVCEEEKKNVKDIKTEKEKIIKENEEKMKEVVNQLTNCREEIKNYVSMNTMLKEENCVLRGIKEVQDKLKDMSNDDVIELEAESSDISDEEAANVFLNNRKDTANEETPKYKCNNCDFEGADEKGLRGHMSLHQPGNGNYD
jgi:hypothetical protein